MCDQWQATRKCRATGTNVSTVEVRTFPSESDAVTWLTAAGYKEQQTFYNGKTKSKISFYKVPLTWDYYWKLEKVQQQ